MVVDLLADCLDVSSGGDERLELLESLLEARDILDGEEDEVLCALGETEPVERRMMSEASRKMPTILLTRRHLQSKN